MKAKLIVALIIIMVLCNSCNNSNLNDPKWMDMKTSFINATAFLESSSDLYSIPNAVDEKSINECLTKIEYALQTWDITDVGDKYGMINLYKKYLNQLMKCLDELDSSVPEARLNREAAVENMSVEFLGRYYEICQNLMGYREITIRDY